MATVVMWIVLSWLLCVSTFGFWLCAYVLLSVLLTLSGFIFVLFLDAKYTSDSKRKFLKYKPFPVSSAGISKVVQQVKHPTKQSKLDQRLTGSVKIDEHLQEMTSYISRDYIDIWYSHISTNREFIHHVQLLFKNVINNISRNTIEVDWVSLFTRQLVDDFASHIRLYRQSEKALRNAQKERSGKYSDLESAFFDFELSMEKTLCRDGVCISENNEKEFLCGLSDMLFYLLLPPEDYKCSILRYFLRDVLSSSIILPTVSLFADPDYLNQNVIWLCKDYPVSRRAFLTVIRRTDSLEELSAVQEIAAHEAKVHKSKDTTNKSDAQKYIESINFVSTLASRRYQKLLKRNSEGETDSVDLLGDADWETLLAPDSGNKLITLPFDIVLNNNIGLHYFTEFMTSINAQGYVFFYHNIEAFRATAESLFSEEEDTGHNPGNSEDSKVEKLRDFASQIFETYLGEKATLPVKLDEKLVTKLHSRLKTEKICENFFDEIQSKVYDIMNEQYFSTEFKVSPYYVKLLAELELLPDSSHQDDVDIPNKCDKVEKYDCFQDIETPSADQDIVITELLGSEVPNSEFCFPESSLLNDFVEGKGDGMLTAEIYNTGITHHAGKTFAVYAIAVSYQRNDGTEQKWFVVRRYSEFHDFHKAVNEKFHDLSHFDFPTKKAFNNLSRHLMEKRRHMLNEYLQFLLSPDNINKHNGLQVMLCRFLEPRDCGNEKKSLVRTVGTFVSPIKTSVKTVGNVMKIVPNTLFGLKDGLVKVLSKTTSPNSEPAIFETDKVSAGLDLDADDIPLRIMLLLIDEVFDLKSKDQWFRKRIMVLLRQIIKTMQGDVINRKLTDYVGSRISVMQVAECLKLVSQAIWPSGILAEPQEERNLNTKMRTRIMAKTLLLSCVPDELKHVIGSETSYRGLMGIFNMLQKPALNRRLFYVLFERLITTLFPDNRMSEVFIKLHSRSPRTAPITPIREEHFGSGKLAGELSKKPSLPRSSSKSKIDGKNSKHSSSDSSSKSKTRLSVSSSSSRDTSPRLGAKRKKSLPSATFYCNYDNPEPATTDISSLH